ncbi:hypothetical protein ACDX78_13595 [Virgibacillus oceani]
MSRLEEIKELHDRIIEAHDTGDIKMELGDLLGELFTEGHTDYLIQHAEELERNLEHGAKVTVKTAEKLYYAQEESHRYKQALEFYAHKTTYEPLQQGRLTMVYSPIEEDCGKKARKALEESE